MKHFIFNEYVLAHVRGHQVCTVIKSEAHNNDSFLLLFAQSVPDIFTSCINTAVAWRVVRTEA